MAGKGYADGKRGAFRTEEVATFRELYRSRDGRITVFEDGEGHITAVNSSRLAQVPQGDDDRSSVEGQADPDDACDSVGESE